MVLLEAYPSRHVTGVPDMTERIWDTFSLFLYYVFTNICLSFPSDGKFLFNFTFLTFYWAYKVRFKGTVPPESLPEIEICLHVRVDRALGEPSPSTGLMIGPLIMTCCDQQLDFFFFTF